MSRGYLMFAHNNPQVDYGLMALCNALMIKANSQEKNVALITDDGTYGWLKQSQGEALVNRAFDHVLLHAPPPAESQKRRFCDTQYTNFDLPWYNTTRASVYDHTPFSETILIDTDYLICDDVLDRVWGSENEFRMNRKAMTLNHEPVSPNETRLEPFGIPMYWATCVYFRKGPFSQSMFELVDVIRDNYDYYQFLYKFPGRLFRNDYAFSIAAHLLNGWSEDQIEPLPNPTLLTSFDCDDLLDIPAKNELLFLVQDSKDTWKYRANRVRSMSTHVMNKFSIIRNAQKIIDLYGSDQ
jgi:hypothetical protein